MEVHGGVRGRVGGPRQVLAGPRHTARAAGRVVDEAAVGAERAGVADRLGGDVAGEVPLGERFATARRGEESRPLELAVEAGRRVVVRVGPGGGERERRAVERGAGRRCERRRRLLRLAGDEALGRQRRDVQRERAGGEVDGDGHVGPRPWTQRADRDGREGVAAAHDGRRDAGRARREVERGVAAGELGDGRGRVLHDRREHQQLESGGRGEGQRPVDPCARAEVDRLVPTVVAAVAGDVDRRRLERRADRPDVG